MPTINANNVNDAYANALWSLSIDSNWIESDSRNGKVRKFIEPVLTKYRYPHERVLFDPVRDANPFLHLFEALWMLNGGNDVIFPAQFTKQFLEYSDDGVTLHGAYGHRWRNHFGHDQLDSAIYELATNPSSRRVVIGMWDPYIDDHVGYAGGKDVPCNSHVYFNVKDKELDMTVCNRSNDLVWGCYGANAVHMSILHEYMALSSGIPIGSYYQFSNDLHLYETHFKFLGKPPKDEEVDDHYATGRVAHQPLFRAPSERGAFDQDVQDFVENPMQNLFRTTFMKDTAGPMYRAWKYFKNGLLESALNTARQIEATDWRKASVEWIERRVPKS